MPERANGPLDRVYRVVFILMRSNVKVRDGQVHNKLFYVVLASP